MAASAIEASAVVSSLAFKRQRSSPETPQRHSSQPLVAQRLLNFFGAETLGGTGSITYLERFRPDLVEADPAGLCPGVS